MLKAEIQPGEAYAIREIRTPGTALQHIRILQHVRGSKWRAEWIDPNPGLVDYVESKNLIVRWKERKAFLRDEEAEKRLEEDNESQGYKADSPLDQAVGCVFESVGEKGLSFFRGVLSAPPDAVDRVKKRAGLEQAKSHSATYIDRFGTVHVCFAEALTIAQNKHE